MYPEPNKETDEMRTAFYWWLTRLVTDIEIAVYGYWYKQKAWLEFCRMPKDELDLILSPDPAASLYMTDLELEIYRNGLVRKRQVLHKQEEDEAKEKKKAG